jgi:glycosyltransferase involved in cell wall biosynthesis
MPTVDLEKRRIEGLRKYAIEQALESLERDRPHFIPDETVVLFCAFEEEGNISHVLDKMPSEVNGGSYTTLVVVDGGTDRTAEICRSYPDVVVIEFPTNLGHGVALQVGYRFCIDRGAKFVVTIDADGQNDPIEIPQLLEPLLEDGTDFVVASRRLGVDNTSDRIRKVGVNFFSFIMNRMTGSHLTDT